ncbi:MAG: DUF2155 domain-containing protein [Rhodospirillaceae bacterium]|nr:DUF2155 domain-containing protein [Rhodospirillaceae bacterium]
MTVPRLFGAGALRPILAVSLALVLGSGPAGAQQTGQDPAAVQPKQTEDGVPEAPFEPDLRNVVLQGLDKETARILTFGGKVGETVRFRTLDIVIRRCQRTPPDQPPERAAFLQIYDIDAETGKRAMVFSGWMFKSRPALSAMDHPIYDVWVKDCT